MQCSKCQHNAVVSLKYLEPLCGMCFCDLIEKRIRKNARLSKAFRRSDRILILDDFSAFIVKRIIEDLPVMIFRQDFSLEDIKTQPKRVLDFLKRNEINKIAVNWAVDDESAEFLYRVFNGVNRGSGFFATHHRLL